MSDAEGMVLSNFSSIKFSNRLGRANELISNLQGSIQKAFKAASSQWQDLDSRKLVSSIEAFVSSNKFCLIKKETLHNRESGKLVRKVEESRNYSKGLAKNVKSIIRSLHTSDYNGALNLVDSFQSLYKEHDRLRKKWSWQKIILSCVIRKLWLGKEH